MIAMNATRRRVGIYVPNGPAYFARVFAGVATYYRGRHRWTIVSWPLVVFPTDSALKQLVAKHAIDGAIAMGTHFWESLAAKSRISVVNIEYNKSPVAALPRVGVDETAIGRLAADHFRERGMRHLAAVGMEESLPAAERLAAFSAAAEAWCPEPVQRYDLPLHHHEFAAHDALQRWLQSLPRPVGVFCWNDEAAKYVHSACEMVEIKIPEEVALLGVDNDEVICNALNPALSSIDPNAQRVGYEAAALLDRLMDGAPAPTQPLIVPPIGIVTRASTDMLAIDDPDVVEAVRFIREHADHSLRVEDVLEHLTMARRSLERQFHAALGRSPRSEINRVLVERARDLLANTDLSIPNIAARCGYPRQNNFTVMFRKQTGQTPTAYRRQTQLTGRTDHDFLTLWRGG